jgi:hypothetical protein
VQYPESSRRPRRGALPNCIAFRAQQAFALMLLPCLALIGGCAGTVTVTSSGAFSVAGTISPAADGSGATVALSGSSSSSTTVNNAGSYTFSGLINGSYAVTPNRTGYVFSPSVQTLTVNGSSVSGINFTAAQLSTHTVKLTWQPSTSSVSGYNVYRSTTSGGAYSKVNTSLIAALTYTDSSLATSTTYYYVTTAVNSAGLESVYSNQVSAQIP